SLFNQESSCTFEQLEGEVLKFLTQAPCETLDTFVDHELGMVRMIDDESTFLATACGCKSGMGANLYRDVGIVNYGPGLLPVGDCSGFGLAGRPRNFSYEEGIIRYQTRIAAPHNRKTGFPVEDSGYSGMWIEVEQSLEKTRCSFDGFRPLSQLSFSFFVKAPFVMVAGSHKLIPKSLDRYMGPPSAVLLDGGLELEVLGGASNMEVIPLAGDESFWGTDFLVSFSLDDSIEFSTCIRDS
ncbi:MAG: hypothetical protein K0U13_01460, partial [Chlamydiae bacterium]|nr:hypothetical protein [Chlamydiota bacterium]